MDLVNPYEDAIRMIGRTLQAFDDDNLIPCYGFGDVTTHETHVFSFFNNDQPAKGIDEALKRYREIAAGTDWLLRIRIADSVFISLKVHIDSVTFVAGHTQSFYLIIDNCMFYDS